MRNVIVAQSGGPTVAINASLAGVITGALVAGYDKIYGSINGIQGVINDNITDLGDVVAADSSFIQKLKTTPAMYLGSCRYKLPKDPADPIYNTLFLQFEKYNIDAFFYIGGNDSMDTVDKLSAMAKNRGSQVRFVGIPKTIDNDLCIIDHTPGFGSAAKYIAATTMEVIYDALIYKNPSVTIVEIMGRDAGWLTAASALAKNDCCPGPDLIYLPEVAFDKEVFINDLKNLLTEKENIVVAVSEGIKDADGNYISATAAANDTFGHAQLSGTGKALEYLVKEKLGVKVRSIEVNVLQRAAAHFSSATDLDEAFKLGETGASLAASGKTGIMVTLKRLSDSPYEVAYEYHDISQIANEVKSVPRSWINEAGNGVTSHMLAYLKPLIIGQPDLDFADGLPVYMPPATL